MRLKLDGDLCYTSILTFPQIQVTFIYRASQFPSLLTLLTANRPQFCCIIQKFKGQAKHLWHIYDVQGIVSLYNIS